MLSYLLGDGSIQSYIIQLLLTLPIILIALSLHETAHGYAAYKLGDPTAHSLGRLTLNPAKHLDPIGFICMLLFGFGWAKPVPINTRYFKKPRRDMLITAVAGPLSNILLAFIFGLSMKLLMLSVGGIPLPIDPISNMKFFLYCFLYYGVRLNIVLAVFNLLPIPPLDGSRLITSFLPPKAAMWVIRNERIIYFVLLGALFIGVLDPVINLLSNGLTNLIFFIFKI